MSTDKDLEIPGTTDSGNPHFYKNGGDWLRRMRYVAAVLSGLTAIIYFLIAFNVVSVLDTPTDQVFGIPAGLAYALGALLLIAVDRRVIWILGAALQVFVIYTYFSLAAQRSPDYEVWGILLRVIQLAILVMLAYLAIRLPVKHSGKAHGVVNQPLKTH